MIKLIIGEKGSGKTKTLIDFINQSAQTSAGRIICIEKSMKMTYNINHAVRVVDVDDYTIKGYDEFYGFLCGVLASDYDIVEVYIDGILKIGDHDMDGLAKLLEKLDEKTSEITLLITVSHSKEDLPASLAKYEAVEHK